ncbi:hypothetical protein NE237_030402 [Protea cynaroides]|uniref:Glutaredoxin domain-containing protein n=1 Tax=Protea cynaroides TaxID=273540 RepID=A0A9Q0JWY0_9MAGN|nr:hypothetical protein NE237_030402 [Protea cynaroides]
MKEKVRMELETTYEKMRRLASENPVVVFTIKDCCMGHVVKCLLFSLGVAPTIIELDDKESGTEMHAVLHDLAATGDAHHHHEPAVFVGGEFLGGVQTLMSSHINGSLVPLLKDAGALWL